MASQRNKTLTGKQLVKANIGQTLVNVSSVAVAVSQATAEVSYMVSDLATYIRKELKEE